MDYVTRVFKDKKPNIKMLLQYGFEKQENGYIYKTNIMNNKLTLFIQISCDNKITTKLIDNEFSEEYVLHLVDFADGEFVTSVKHEFESVLMDISNRCFKKEVFKSYQARQVINYCFEKYGDSLEFLWEKVDDNAIIRRKDTNKWYVALLMVTKEKLGLEGEEKVEVLDLKLQSQKIEALIDNKTYFPAYHMNKKHWVTVLLSNNSNCEEIFRLIDTSYMLAK